MQAGRGIGGFTLHFGQLQEPVGLLTFQYMVYKMIKHY